jgi:hypothetical protein
LLRKFLDFLRGKKQGTVAAQTIRKPKHMTDPIADENHYVTIMKPDTLVPMYKHVYPELGTKWTEDERWAERHLNARGAHIVAKRHLGDEPYVLGLIKRPGK